jgi:hypothetical protein
MRRTRVALLFAAAAAMVASACSPPGPTPSPQSSLPPPPTAAVGADGQPIQSLCDLLSSQDFSTVIGGTATAPDTSKASATSATCEYGKNLRLVANVSASADEADLAFDQASKKLSAPEAGTMAGVDESASGTTSGNLGLVVRRRLLVFTIEIPANVDQGKFKLIQLGGMVLERAHALGT